MLERWPQVCRIKITLTLLLLTNRYISTTSNSMKCSKLCSTENPCSFEKYSTTLKNLYKFDPIQSCNGNFVPNEPSSLRKIMNFHRNSSANSILCVFTNFKPVFEPVPGSFMINVQSEPLHDMVCVVKRGPPPGWRWRLCEFQHWKSLFFPGTNKMLWRGWVHTL